METSTLYLLGAANAVLLGLLAWTGSRLLRYRRFVRDAFREEEPPIPTVRLEEFDPLFRTDEMGPTLRTEVAFVGTGDGVPFGTSDLEAWVLAVLAKPAVRMFEFGTATGKTAYLWARNSAPEARVTTLTLAPDQVAAYAGDAADSAEGTRTALAESTFTRFFYTGTPVEEKVEQLFADSKQFDEGPFAGSCDLVFVDGSHAYSYVKSDTEKALRMVRPGGVVLWHDYRGSRGPTADVYAYLNELGRSLPLARLEGTSLVAYRAPLGGGA
ncbi:MAG TPA: class I SAM-dependent methyltransferase [Longimicrobiaceae bacterium]|nr:class I SAM-dependent methyltransferase [Longimicrobiaceae bacterium]